jgi:predicted ATPase
MILSLTLTNFKAFKDQILLFKPLTLLSGLNSTGKSSVLQALLLLRQSSQKGSLIEKGLMLNGDLINIGTAKDAIFEGASKQDKVGFEILWKNGIKGVWNFKNEEEIEALKYKEEEIGANFIKVVSAPVDSKVYESSLFNHKFHYIEAERIGPRVFNQMSYSTVQLLGTLGNRCEYTLHFLAVNEKKPIPNSKLSHPNVKVSKPQYDSPEIPSLNLIDQVEAWMGEISPGTRIKLNSNPDMDVINFQCGYGDSNHYRATNVGFGITYTLPIIVAVLASEPDTLILVENPEAHLHPRGQVKMGELLALAASCGVQIVIETHSDHVLNGIRLAVHGGKLNPEDVQLHYFQRQEKQQETITKVVSPRIDKNGRIDQWPDGFFDEWEKNLITLLKPRDV